MSDSNMTLTQKRISNSKIFVYVSLALGLALDVAVFSLLVAYALPVKYWIVPLLLAVFDLGFSAVSFVSNFRFGYFKPHLIIYSVAVTVLSLVAFLVGSDFGGGSAYTSLALVVYPAVHLVVVAAVVLTIVFSIHNGTTAKALGLVAAAALLAVTTCYTVVLIGNGYFGQPLEQETRVLLFSYDEAADGYAVVGVEGGAGTRVVVPDEFDGKKVKSVNCGIFNAEGVSKVELACSPEVSFYNRDELDIIKDELVISVDKSNFDTVRNHFYGDDHVRAVRRMEPSGLGENEVFVTFAFTYELNKAELYPTWYGNKGDVLTLGDDAPSWYKHGDPTCAADMYFAYHSNNKMMFAGLLSQGNDINGQAILSNYGNVEAKFDRVYQIYIGNDNDDAYESPQSYRYSLVNGAYDPFRYVTLDTANALTSQIPQRSGFSVRFVEPYSHATISTLYTYLQAAGNASAVTIIPNWTLDAPTVTQLSGNPLPVYGETLSLSASASHAMSGVSLKYEWFVDSRKISNSGSSISINNVVMADSGNYALRVTAYSEGGALTSLESSTVVSSNVIVQKRELHFEWTVPDDTMYSGADKEFTAAYVASDVINGDNIEFSQNRVLIRNAGSYTLSVELLGDCADKYRAVGDRPFTIERAPLTITASDVAKIYDGEPVPSSACSYTAVGLLGNDVLSTPSYTSAAFNHADCAPYAVSVAFPLSYGTLSNYAVDYRDGVAKINKRTITVEWGDDELTYNGTAQGIVITKVNNAVAGENVVGMFEYDRDSMGVDVDDYLIKATLSSKNYTLGDSETVTHPFSIVPRKISLNWGYTNFTYNGELQHPVILGANNIAQRDRDTYISKIVYLGAKKDVGADYVASATIDDKNYEVEPNQTCLFTIYKKTVSFVWSGDGPFPYDGLTHTPTVTDITGAVESEKTELLASISYVGTAGTSLKNKGYTTVTASLDNTNYMLTANSTKAVVQVYAKEILVAWKGSGTYDYDGLPHGATIASINGAVAGEEESMLAAITYTSTNGLTITEVGSTKITADLNNANYSAWPLTVTVTVVKRSVTLVWSNESFTYNGSAQAPTVQAVMNAVGDDAEMLLSRLTVSAGGTDAGDHTVTASLNSSVANYTIEPESQSCDYTIEKKTLMLVWDEVEFSYTGSPITVSPANAGLLPVELIATYYQGSVRLGDAPTEAGSYSVVYSLNPVGAVNYTLVNNECDFVINA